MKSQFRNAGIAAVAVFYLLTTAVAAFAFPSVFGEPPIYVIQGYLDRAPEGATVIDRVQIAATGGPTRSLLVTVYRNPGDLLLDRFLSRELMSPYLVRGKSEEVARLLGAPEGAEIKGTFVVYTDGLPLLFIAQLDLPS